MISQVDLAMNQSQSGRRTLPAVIDGVRVVSEPPPARLVKSSRARINSRVHLATGRIEGSIGGDQLSEGAVFLCGGWVLSPTWLDRARRSDGLLCAECLSRSQSPCVYRMFDGKGALLYVGSTGALRSRLINHSTQSAWWPLARQVTSEIYPSIDEARDRENAAIFGEAPRFNIRGVSRKEESA